MYCKIVDYTLNKLFFNKFFKKISSNILLISFFFIWFFEWFFIFEYCLQYESFHYLIFPYRIPSLLIICFIYFLYVWGISVWRRTQYGRFTRGDRKLWFKGYASFWIVELSTVLGLFLAACWMNWGPRPLFPRSFYMPRKGFLIELTFFTYISWTLYLMRFSMKWNKWKFQYFLTFFILILTFCLIWRDLLILIGRENISLKNSYRWRYITANNTIYSFVPQWWTEHYINQNKIHDNSSLFFSLNTYLNIINDTKTPFFKSINFNEYEKYNFTPLTGIIDWKKNSIILYSTINLFFKNFLNIYYISNNSLKNLNDIFYTIDSNILYPRRIGYQTKRIGMWTLLFFLKLWHHIMLFIWWFFYLIRLKNKKKNSYTWLSICYFNIYCCFIISLLIFIFSYLHFYETFFRVTKSKPFLRSEFKFITRMNWGVEYLYYLFLSFLNFSFYKNSTNDIFKVGFKIINRVF